MKVEEKEWTEGMSDAEVQAEVLFSHGCAYGTVALMETLKDTAETHEAFGFVGLQVLKPVWEDTAAGIVSTFDDGSVMAFSTAIENGERCAVGAWEVMDAEEWARVIQTAERFPIVWADASEEEWLQFGAGRGFGGGDGYQQSAVCDSCGFDLPFLFKVEQPVADRPRFLCHFCLTNDAQLPRFKHGCGYETTHGFTIEVISMLGGDCPSCHGPIADEDFISA